MEIPRYSVHNDSQNERNLQGERCEAKRSEILFLLFFFPMKKFLLPPLSDKKNEIAKYAERDQRNKQKIVSEEIDVAGIHSEVR